MLRFSHGSVLQSLSKIKDRPSECEMQVVASPFDIAVMVVFRLFGDTPF